MSENYITLLKDLLATGRMTQGALAAKLGVTFPALNRWLNRRAKPHPGRIEAIRKLHRELIGYRAFTPPQIAGWVRQAGRFRRRQIWKIVSQNKELRNELILEHTYNSTTIEGNTMTKRETEAVVFKHQTISDKSLAEHLEMTNHAAVLGKILTGEYEGPVTESFIHLIHRDLMQGIREDAGHYSKYHRAIRGVDLALTHPKDIAEEMASLAASWRKKRKVTIRDIAGFHVNFELIHPFGDGNGRVGRLLMAVQCLTAGYLPLVIENERKLEYYEVLEYAQRKSDGPFVAFLVHELERTDRLFRKYEKA